MPPPDSTRYSLPPPPKSKRDDPEAWEAAVKNAKAQLEHQTLRIQNLELMLKYGPNQWRAYNASLEAAIKRCARAASDVRFIRGEARSRERWGTLNFDLPLEKKKLPPPPADRSIPVLTRPSPSLPSSSRQGRPRDRGAKGGDRGAQRATKTETDRGRGEAPEARARVLRGVPKERRARLRHQEARGGEASEGGRGRRRRRRRRRRRGTKKRADGRSAGGADLW